MWKLWLLYEPKRLLPILFIFLLGLAILIHAIVLSTPRFNWLVHEKPAVATPQALAPPPAPAAAAPPPAAPATPKVVADCQTSVNGAINGAVIQFDTGKASLAAGSHALLDGVAAALKPCDGTVVEVAGHTDATGRADANMALSAARAQAVVDYLKADGVPGARLTAKGYGATRPLDPARTPEADKKNRRIDFTVAAASS